MNAQRVPSITDPSKRRKMNKVPSISEFCSLAAHLKRTAPVGVPVDAQYLRDKMRHAVAGICSPRDYPFEALLIEFNEALKTRRMKFDKVVPPGKLGRSEMLRAHVILFGNDAVSFGKRVIADEPIEELHFRGEITSRSGVQGTKLIRETINGQQPYADDVKGPIRTTNMYKSLRDEAFISPIMKRLITQDSKTRPLSAPHSKLGSTFRNLETKDRMQQLFNSSPFLGRMTTEFYTSPGISRLLGTDIRVRRLYGLEHIKRNELLRLKAIRLPNSIVWLVFVALHSLLESQRGILERHLTKFRDEEFLFDEGTKLDLSPADDFDPRTKEIDFSLASLQKELGNPRLLLLKLQTIVHIVFEYGLQTEVLENIANITSRDIFNPRKIETISLTCAHLSQWVLDVMAIAKYYETQPETMAVNKDIMDIIKRNQLTRSQMKVHRSVGDYEYNISVANGMAAISKRVLKERVFMVLVENTTLCAHAFKTMMELLTNKDRALVIVSSSKKSKRESSNNQAPQQVALRFRFDLKSYKNSKKHKVLCMERPEECSLKEHMGFLASSFNVDFLVCGISESKSSKRQGVVSTLGSDSDLGMHRSFCTFMGIKQRTSLRGPGNQHYLVPVDGSEETHDALIMAESLLISGDRLTVVFERNIAAGMAYNLHRWSTIKARCDNRNITAFVVDSLEETLNALRPNFVVVGIAFHLHPLAERLKNHEKYIKGLGPDCVSFNTIIVPRRTKEFMMAREQDQQFPMLNDLGQPVSSLALAQAY